MKSLVICEKPDQARSIKAAVGNSFGPIIPFVGHIAELESPKEENPNWKAWTNEILCPQRGYYNTRIIPKHRSIITNLRAEMAKVDTIIIATDFDREGQLIAQEVLEIVGWKGKKLRAVFTALDKKSLTKAFNNLEDNAKYEGWFQAGKARQQTDQIFNLTLTRVVTNNLKKPYSSDKAIGIGRVKTPTMSIICKIEDEILNFVPDAYWTIAATVEGAAGKVTLKHGGNPNSDNFLRTEQYAQELAKSAAKFSGPIAIKKEKKEKDPPRPFDFTSLANAASAAFGFSMDKVLTLAQSLYEHHKIATYPRASCRYIGESMIPDASPMLKMLKNIPDYSKYGLVSPVIRKGKTGVYCDEIVNKESHHAIIPNVNVMDNTTSFMSIYNGLSSDEKKLFDLIARQFLASIGESMKYDSTEASANIQHDQKDHKFIARGQIITFPGYLEILKNVEPDDEENEKIPPFKDKDPVKTIAIKIIAEETKPPSRLSEGQLGMAMQEAWKYIENPEERAKLKETKGIGTAATRSQILKGLKEQNLLALSGKKIMPSPGAMEIYYTLKEVAPELIDIGATARMEKILDGIADGKYTVQQAINDTCKKMVPIIDNIIKVAGKVSIDMSLKVVPASRKRGAKNTSSGTAPQKTNSKTKPANSTAKPIAKASTTTQKPSGSIKEGTLLKIPFEKKDEAKAMGCRWSQDAKSWYAPTGSDLTEFKKKGWL